MAILQFVLLYLVGLYLVLAQSTSPPLPRYTLRVMDVSPFRLTCYDSSTGDAADIDDVTFWRNRSLPNDPGLRERRDMPVFVDQIENEIVFTLTRKFEGNYTCGRQLMGTVEEESAPVPLVSRQPFTDVGKIFIFYAITRNQAVLHCPIQPGKLIQYYYGRWVKDGNTLVELPQPISGNPQEIMRSDDRYDLNMSTFSLIINSVEASDAGDTSYQCILNVVDPRNNLPIYLQTDTVSLTLRVNAEPEIPSEIQVINGVTAFLDESADDRLPSFTCAAAGLPAPIITWIYIPNLDREHKISLSDGEKYQIIVSNVSEKDDGRQVTTSTLTFLELTATDGGLVRCRASSQPTTQVASADAHFTVIGQPDHIDVLISTKGEFIYDVALPVLLQHPVKLNISYVDQNHQSGSPGRLTTTEYNDTNSILYQEMDAGQLPYEKYFVRISIVAEFKNGRIEGPPLTSSELIDTTKPYAVDIIAWLSTTCILLMITTGVLVILLCGAAIGCICICIYYRHGKGSRGV